LRLVSSIGLRKSIWTSHTIHLGPVEVPGQSAFTTCFVVAASAAFAGALVTLLIPRSRPTVVAGKAAEKVPALG
jgi:hypothetical protein